MPRGFRTNERARRCQGCAANTAHPSGKCTRCRLKVRTPKPSGPRPVACKCPECKVPFTGRILMREHRYREHGVHWSENRPVRKRRRDEESEAA